MYNFFEIRRDADIFILKLIIEEEKAKIGFKTTKKGLKPLFLWYQTYALNMSFCISNDSNFKSEINSVYYMIPIFNQKTLF